MEEEIPCWRQKLRNSYKELEKLKNEIKSSKLANILQIYLNSKNLQVQSSKQTLINKHITTIDTEVVVNAHWLQRAFTLAAEVIKNGNLNTEQRYHYDQLQRHLLGSTLGSRQIDLEIGETIINGINSSASSDEEVDQMCTNDINIGKRSCGKRLHLEDYNLDDLDGMDGSDYDDDVGGGGGSCGESIDMHTTFKMPAKKARINNLNETHVLSDESNANATFFMGPTSSSSATKPKSIMRNGKVLTNKKTELVTNVLSEQIVKGPSNAEQLKSGKYLLIYRNRYT